jgi:hypothetical protein
VAARRGTGLPPATAGDLEFGEGKLLKLEELVKRAQTQFKTRYRYDRRFAPCQVFVSGAWSRETFDRTLADYLRSSGLERAGAEEPGVPNLDDLFRGRLERLAQGMPDFDEATNVTADDVRGKRKGTVEGLLGPGWAKRLGLSESAQGSLGLVLGLDLGVPGMFDMGRDSSGMRRMEPGYRTFIITP